MNISCNSLKEYIETAFSMPFVVTQTTKDGESRYTCHPVNEGEIFFDSTVYIHNNVRVVVEIIPQRHGGDLLYEISKATSEQRERFFDYIRILENKNAKIQFLVNGINLKTIQQWPSTWKSLSCRITKVPLTDDNDEYDEFQVISEWMKHSICLIFSTLTITDVENYPTMVCESGCEEGYLYRTTTNRYERNPINRELCLAKKGYKCQICNFDFKEVYGSIGKQFIEVHHITPVSTLGPGYRIDVEKDLIPVCANCHAMLHKKNPPYLPNELNIIITTTKAKRKQLICESEKNVLMAITYPAHIENTIALGKIAIGIRDEQLEKIDYKIIKYVLLHNWQNENSYLFRTEIEPRLVDKGDIPSGYFLKYKEASSFLLLDINQSNNLFNDKYDVLHLQPSNRKIRYDLLVASIDELMEPDV